MAAYDDRAILARNLGTLGEDGQERLYRSRVLVVGTGGVGGTVAVELARSGVGKLVLIDLDRYEASNANRQIACDSSTIGKPKARAVADAVLAIRPEIHAEAIERALGLDELEGAIRECDAVFPAADDFAYSLAAFRIARKLGKPALMVVPAGFHALVTLFGPRSPRAEAMFGIPVIPELEASRAFFREVVYPSAKDHYLGLAGWERTHYEAFARGEAAPSQLCPVVWAAASLGALEPVKALSGKGRPVLAPRYYRLDAKGARTLSLRSPTISSARVVLRSMFLARAARRCR